MRKITGSNIAFYTFAHMCVDMVCMWVMAGFFAGRSLEAALTVAVFYNFFAFAAQPVIGMVTDRVKKPRLTASAGFVLLLGGVLVARMNMAASVALIGLGNAAFHVGAGVAVFQLKPESPVFTGIFVSSGALGLALGGLLFKIIFTPWFFVLLIAALLALNFFIKSHKSNYKLPAPAGGVNIVPAAVMFLLMAIVIRSFVGGNLGLGYEVAPWQKWAMVFAVVFGKAAGGFAAEKLGLARAGAIPLVLAAPLMFLGRTYFAPLVTGLFLFQFAMPVALYLLYRAMPGRAGFAVGLNCLALFLGFWAFGKSGPLPSAVFTLFAAACVYGAAKLLLDGKRARAAGQKT